jgi:rhamnogalacturonan endolyase
MGSTYYYTAYADEQGRFTIPDVRVATYGLQAWSNGSTIADVTTSFLQNGVTVTKDVETRLGTMVWAVSNKTKLFQVGEFDRYSYGFQFGGAPNTHALVAGCPANLNFTAGCSPASAWCFGQTYQGNWTIRFRVGEDTAASAGKRNASLIVSLAGYSSGSSSTIWANNVKVGNLTSGTPSLLSDPCLYRSGTAAGEWRLIQFDFDAGILSKGWNYLTFQMTRNTTWHGFMWDSIKLEW